MGGRVEVLSLRKFSARSQSRLIACISAVALLAHFPRYSDLVLLSSGGPIAQCAFELGLCQIPRPSTFFFRFHFFFFFLIFSWLVYVAIAIPLLNGVFFSEFYFHPGPPM